MGTFVLSVPVGTLVLYVPVLVFVCAKLCGIGLYVSAFKPNNPGELAMAEAPALAGAKGAKVFR